MVDTKEIIFNILNDKFQPELIEVIDESDKHKGHSGYEEGKQTHFLVKIKSRYFDKLSKIAAHREINNLLSELFKNNIHALSIKIIN